MGTCKDSGGAGFPLCRLPLYGVGGGAEPTMRASSTAGVLWPLRVPSCDPPPGFARGRAHCPSMARPRPATTTRGGQWGGQWGGLGGLGVGSVWIWANWGSALAPGQVGMY
jgi:hypothetical protein